MKTFAQQVVEFNQQVLGIKQRQVSELPTHEFEISMACLQEEIDEFEQAVKSGDVIGAVDAMVDLMYFANGVLYKMGLTAQKIDACCEAVHNANMEKKLGVNAKRAVEGAADAVEPDGWVSPEERIAAILGAQQ